MTEQGDLSAAEGNAVPHLNVPDTFPFPFTPYSIQLGFMKKLYETLEYSQIGLFESPTGTGKSLSIICSALQWLRDTLEKIDKEAEKVDSPKKKADGDPDWVTQFDGQSRAIAKSRANAKLNKKIERARKRMKRESGTESKKPRVQGKERAIAWWEDAGEEEGEEAPLILDLPDNEGSDGYDYSSDSDSDLDDEPEPETLISRPRIIYCSRTHSQLSQFVLEIGKTIFGRDLRCVTLSSRRLLCINESVLALGDPTAINERCLELRGSSNESDEDKDKPKKNTCPYLVSALQSRLADSIVAKVQDIEEIRSRGNTMQSCPYYAARRAIKDAELICVPYNCVLHDYTRESLGIPLENSVVIFDEAHNVIDAVSEVYSTRITGTSLARAYYQLETYYNRFESRFKHEHITYLSNALFLLRALADRIGALSLLDPDAKSKVKLEKQGENTVTVHRSNDLVAMLNVDNINIFNILRYFKEEHVANKTMGYRPLLEVNGESVDQISSKIFSLDARNMMVWGGTEKSKDGEELKRSYVRDIEALLSALCNPDKDGRLVITRDFSNPLKSVIKFLLLSPLAHFEKVLKDARSVVLAGGTLQPFGDIRSQLLASIPISRISVYSCGHVVPESNLMVRCIGWGPSGKSLEFSFEKRAQTNVLDELGESLISIAKTVPGGLVVFFPSYAYADLVFERWQKTGLYFRLASVKHVFKEERSGKKGVFDSLEDLLREYQRCCDEIVESKDLSDVVERKSVGPKGAILCAIVGGKLSEGINFGDNYGRCVVMVGLPFPNSLDPELKERMNHIGELASKHGSEETLAGMNRVLSLPKNPKIAAKQYYENICMKAVNQSIGRVIRHQNDYACILLFDTRYTYRHELRMKLPGWISKLIPTTRSRQNFAEVIKQMSTFFLNPKFT